MTRHDDNSARPMGIDLETLRGWPLPMPDGEGDKEARGRLLIIGGSREIAGAVVLAATAALRAGAGKVAVATIDAMAPHLAVALPETRVISLPATRHGGIDPAATALLEAPVSRADAVLIGPGMQDEEATCALVRALLPKLSGKQVILDAGAMNVICMQDGSFPGRPPLPASFAEGSDLPQADTMRQRGTGSEKGGGTFCFSEPVLLTPHAGEMAHLTGLDKEAIQNDPVRVALDAAQRWNAVVALKGAITHLAHPGGQLWRHDQGNIGLAASGSGDVLAGLIGGLAARGAPLEQAAAWGVALHAAAGDILAKRLGLLGYLAREIPAEIPALMDGRGPEAALPFF